MGVERVEDISFGLEVDWTVLNGSAKGGRGYKIGRISICRVEDHLVEEVASR